MASSERTTGYARALERASRSERVSPGLQGVLRALATRRRRSGRDDERLVADELQLQRLLDGVFHGDADASARAAEIARRLLSGR